MTASVPSVQVEEVGGPDLLSAAQSIMPFLLVIDSWEDLPFPAVFERRLADLKVAISKATGGSQ